MTERDKQTDFLMRLLVLADCKGDDLQARIQQAQHDENSVRFAFILVALIGGFALAGLGYCAVLHPDFLNNSAPTLVKIFCAVALGCLICMLVFLACWLWYRNVSNKVYEECRKRVLDAIHTRLKSHPSPVFVQTLDFSLPVQAKQGRKSAVG